MAEIGLVLESLYSRVREYVRSEDGKVDSHVDDDVSAGSNKSVDRRRTRSRSRRRCCSRSRSRNRRRAGQITGVAVAQEADAAVAHVATAAVVCVLSAVADQVTVATTLEAIDLIAGAAVHETVDVVGLESDGLRDARLLLKGPQGPQRPTCHKRRTLAQATRICSMGRTAKLRFNITKTTKCSCQQWCRRRWALGCEMALLPQIPRRFATILACSSRTTGFSIKPPLLDEWMARRVKQLPSAKSIEAVEKMLVSVQFKIMDIGLPIIQLYTTLRALPEIPDDETSSPGYVL